MIRQLVSEKTFYRFNVPIVPGRAPHMIGPFVPARNPQGGALCARLCRLDYILCSYRVKDIDGVYGGYAEPARYCNLRSGA
jgi:hypothetical protein